MSEPSPQPAIFLSYARDDAAAARRIAEALRASGLEVWFDENELRGGDAWDQKIRRQINDCALFVPLVSRQTEARAKGYFRLEWKLAVDQVQMLAEGVPFIAPVAIDDTRETGARVPAEFMRVQWTRLPGALATPQFVEQIKRLLETAPVAGVTAPPMRTAAAAVATLVASAPRSRSPLIAVGAIAIGTAIFFALRPAAEEKSPAAEAPKAVAETKAALVPAASVPKVADKSIAVLPFANRSPNKEDEFFTDGIHDDILTNLSNLRELHVVSRTSVEQYRGTTKTMKQVGAELGVAYLLEGGVQRVGNKVHVTGQLIDARTDTHLWAKSFDKDVSDLFAIQAELATAIAGELKAVLSPQEKARLDRAPTTNAAAYELVLKAYAARTWEEARPLLESAVQLDPKFAQAWGWLGRALAELNVRRHDSTGALQEKAQRAVDTMERLAPDEPDTLLQLARYYSRINDVARSEAYVARAAKALPGSAEVALLLGNVEKLHHRFTEALAQYRKAYELDRQGEDIRPTLVAWLEALRRYDEAEQIQRDNFGADGLAVASVAFRARGATSGIEAWLAANPQNLTTRANNLWPIGNAAEYVRVQDQRRQQGGIETFSNNEETQIIIARMAIGDTARAKADAARFLADHKGAIGRLNALNFAIVGDKQAALDTMGKYVADAKSRGVDLDLSNFSFGYASVLAWAGEKDKAVAELTRLLKLPSNTNVHALRHQPWWHPLQGYPPFEALLADPKNNAPLL